jgi:uncharacterized membrane protein HdeD (DUF308 family)
VLGAIIGIVWGWAFALGLISVLAGLVFLFGNPIISVVVLPSCSPAT